jgi:hypothetical protein
LQNTVNAVSFRFSKKRKTDGESDKGF